MVQESLCHYSMWSLKQTSEDIGECLVPYSSLWRLLLGFHVGTGQGSGSYFGASTALMANDSTGNRVRTLALAADEDNEENNAHKVQVPA